jgi:hypothetical protein
MAANIRVILSVEIDNEPIRGYPLVRRLSVDELVGFQYEQADSSGFTDIPDAVLTTGQFVLIQPDQNVDVQFSDGAAGANSVQVNAGGLLLVLDGSWSNGIEVDNNSGSTVLVKGQVGGT